MTEMIAALAATSTAQVDDDVAAEFDQQPLVRWSTVDFATGQRGGDLQVHPDARFGRIIGTETSSTLRVRCVDQGRQLGGWDEGTAKGRALLLATDTVDDRILWGGLVDRRERPLASGWVSVRCTTLEDYLDRRYLDGTIYHDTDSTRVGAIAKEAAEKVLTASERTTGPWRVPGVIADSTPFVGADYTTDDDATLRRILDDLAGLRGGTEWTVDLEWETSDHDRVLYVLRTAQRLGVATNPTIWTHPGCITEATYVEDYGRDTGANDVMAIGPGQGDSRPVSARNTDDTLLGGAWARFERRWSPAQTPTDEASSNLDRYAEAELRRVRLGLDQLQIVARIDDAPRLNQDWWLGDDIDVDLESENFPVAVVDGIETPSFSRRVRVVGWEMNAQARTLTPRCREIEEPQ